ncbi:unknown [Proteobacteria bacterium CAG:495]|nr:unknown [Proteobacteria bacterium CAG:495]
MLLFKIQTEIDEFVYAVFRLVTDARNKLSPAVHFIQNIGIQLKRPYEVRHIQQRLQFRINFSVLRIRSQPGPQAFVSPVITQLKQIVVRQSPQRRLQNCRQGQIIARQKDKFTDSNQILHGNLLQQTYFIYACNGHTRIFAGTDKLFYKAVAPLNQYHKVFIAQGTVLRRQQLFPFYQAFYPLRYHFCQTGTRRFCRHPFNRRQPYVGIFAIASFYQRP